MGNRVEILSAILIRSPIGLKMLIILPSRVPQSLHFSLSFGDLLGLRDLIFFGGKHGRKGEELILFKGMLLQAARRGTGGRTTFVVGKLSVVSGKIGGPLDERKSEMLTLSNSPSGEKIEIFVSAGTKSCLGFVSVTGIIFAVAF